jgi:hypothetical protein
LLQRSAGAPRKKFLLKYFLCYACICKQSTKRKPTNMDSNLEPTTTQYQQVTVDVPEDRIAEFHAFFARFLAGATGRGRRGPHGRRHHGVRGRQCGRRGQAAERGDAVGQPVETTEI